MRQRVPDPLPEDANAELRATEASVRGVVPTSVVHAHKLVLLAKHVELRVPIQHACADELIKDSEDDRWKDGEQDVVEGEGP